MKESISYWLSHEEDRFVFVEFKLSRADLEGTTSLHDLFDLHLILRFCVLGLSWVDASFLSGFCELICDTHIELLLEFFSIGDKARQA